MAAGRLQGHRLLPQKSGVEIEPRHTPGLANGPEHLIRQVPAHRIHPAAVGVAGADGAGGDVHHIPESLVAEVTHIQRHAITLGPAHIFLPLPGEAPAGLVRSGQGIGFIPGEGGHAEAQSRQLLQPARVKADPGGPLQRKHRGDLSIVHRLANFRRGPGLDDSVPVFLQLPLEVLQHGAENHLRRTHSRGIHAGRGKKGKELGVASQLSAPLQVDVALPLSEPLHRAAVVVQQLQGGIAVQIKHRQIH